MLPRDFTKQEQNIASVLDTLGFRYEQQRTFGRYTVDFFVPELDLIIEADGPHGHLRKSDRKRDALLIENQEISYVIHVKSKTLSDLEGELESNLIKLANEYIIGDSCQD